jgi:hypothetical protein
LSNISIAQNDAAVSATLLELLVGAMYPNIVASLTPPYIHEIGIVHGEGPDTVGGSEVLFSDGLGEEVYTFGSFSIATSPFVPQILTGGTIIGGYQLIVPIKLIDKKSLGTLFHQNHVVRTGVGRDK